MGNLLVAHDLRRDGMSGLITALPSGLTEPREVLKRITAHSFHQRDSSLKLSLFATTTRSIPDIRRDRDFQSPRLARQSEIGRSIGTRHTFGMRRDIAKGKGHNPLIASIDGKGDNAMGAAFRNRGRRLRSRLPCAGTSDRKASRAKGLRYPKKSAPKDISRRANLDSGCYSFG